MTEREQWRTVPDWPGYQVSDRGRVRSVDRRLPNGQWCGGKVLKQHPDSRGYLRVLLRDGKRVSTRRVHVLVMETFKGPRPPGLHILHRNDRKDRNELESLRYGTASENEREKRERIKGKGTKRERRYRREAPGDTSPESPGSQWPLSSSSAS